MSLTGNFLKLVCSVIRLITMSVLLLASPPVIYGQILKGKITNEAGEAIPYATVYLHEIRQGTTANARGDYEIRLSPGKYQVTYQSLGYGPVIQSIAISDQPLVRNAVLPLQYYMIPEVRITATGEDPAYGIMRKAIGMAPYYLNNISYYKAEVYLKGNLVMNRIPKLFQKAMKMEARQAEAEGRSGTVMKEGDVYLIESFNEVEFTAPDKFNQKVISFNSTFPDSEDNISPMDFINASFYQPMIGEIAISPLSPQAFSYYKFQYLGATPQGNNTINKIRVIPKMKSQQLFDGIIYIIEDLWCLQSVDLTNENIAGKISVKQLYIPVKDEIWMPVSHNFVMNISIIGVRADAGYTGSVKYLEVRTNESLRKPESLTADFYKRQAGAATSQNVSKNQEKIEELLKKDELNNRDMVRLSKLTEQESKKAQPDSVVRSLEIQENTVRTVEKDATKKDSAYWAEVRPIPLSDVEFKSIRLRDSLKTESTLKQSALKTDSLQEGGKKQKNKFLRTLNDIALGHTWSDSTGLRFHFGGLIELGSLSFNTVDGFKYGLNFRISRDWKNRSSLTIAPDLRWAFSREKLLWRVNTNYSFNRMKQRSVSLGAGITSRDISTGGGINLLLNSITSLFMENNYLKLYETRYINAAYRSELANGLNLTLSAGFDDRRLLENTTSYSFVSNVREYSPNLPVNFYLDSTSNPVNALRDMRHYEFSANVVYTPRQKYSIRNGVKINRGSDWPTFGFTWKHGINEFSEPENRVRHYDMLKLEVSKFHNLGAFTEFNWRIRTGGFLDNRYVPYYDFFHMNEQPLLVLLDNYQDAFMLHAYYSLSTPELYGEVHIKYTTPYLLLKYLPGLSKTLMRENLSLSYLGSRYHLNYTEIGYSITELFLLGEAGVYVGFDDLRFRSVGAKIVIRLN